MADDNNIKLKLQVDTSDAKKSMTSFEQSISKAFSSNNDKVKKLGTQLNSTIIKLKQYQAKAKEMETTKVPTEQYTTLKNKIDEVTKSYESAKKQRSALLSNSDNYTAQYLALSNDAQKYTKNLNDAKSVLGTVRNSLSGVQTLSQSQVSLLQQAESEVTKWNTKLQETRTIMQRMEANGISLENVADFTEATQNVQQYEYELQNLQTQMSALETSGQTSITLADAEPEKYQAVQSNIAGCANQAQIFSNAIATAISNSSTLKSVSNSLNQAWTSFANTAKSAINKVSNYLKSKLQNSITSTKNTSNKSFKSMLTTVLKYGFGIRSIFLLYKKVRSTISTGIGEMAKDFSDVNATASELYNSWNTFKSSIVSAFEPIYTYIVPALSTMLDYLTDAMNSLANFFANLTGASTYKKAIKQNNDYASSLSDTADSADEATEKLADYDELLVIDQDTDSSSSSTDTWQWVDVATEASEWADTIKDALTDWDFTEVGEKINDALVNAMKSIDWDTIYGYASNFGKGLATFLNGLIDEELFSELGTTLAKALKTALLSINTFATEFEWDELGDSIAAGINAFFEEFDITLATDTFNKIAKGILSTLINAIKGIEWSDISDTITEAIEGIDTEGIGEKFGTLVSSITNAFYTLVSNSETWIALGTKIGDGINGFFESMNMVDSSTGLTGWQALGESIADTFLGFGDTIITALDTIDWEAIGQSIVDFFTSISWSDLFMKAVELKGAIEDAIEGLLKGLGIDIGDVDLVIASIAAITLSSLAKSFITSTLPAIIKTQCMSVIGGAGSVSIGTVAVTALVTATLSWQIGTKLYESASGHEVEQGFFEEIQDIIQGFGEDQIEFNLLDFIEFTVSDSEGWYKDYAEWAGGLGDKLYDLLHKHIPGIIDEFVPAWEELVSGWWENIKGRFLDLINWNEIIELFDKQTWSDLFNYLVQDLQDIFSPIVDWFDDLFGDSIDAIKECFDPQTWKDFWDALWGDIKSIFGSVKTWFDEKFSSAWEGVKDAWGAVGEFFSGIWDSITGVFTGVKEWFQEKWEGAYSAVTDVFDGISDFFGGIWDTISTNFEDFGTNIYSAISDAITSGLNTVMGFFEDTLNDSIDVINSVIDAINVFDWGEDATTGEYIDHVTLPKFARGGVFDKATMGIFGEAGTEAVMPLENNLEWLDKLASMITDRAIPSIVQGLVLPMSEEFMKAVSSSSIGGEDKLTTADIVDAVSEAINRTKSEDDHSPIVVQIAGRQVAEVVWSESEKKYKQTGLRPAYT